MRPARPTFAVQDRTYRGLHRQLRTPIRFTEKRVIWGQPTATWDYIFIPL